MNPQRIKARLAAKGKKTSPRWKKNKKLVRGSNPR